MYKVIIESNASFTLPACTFTVPTGKEFDKWDKGALWTGEISIIRKNCDKKMAQPPHISNAGLRLVLL